MHHCLIIEDDSRNAHYIANGLRELGYIVSVAGDGVEGLTRAMTEHWDAIVLDRMLPNDVDGLSIVSTLRSLGKNTPILILSALSAIDERVKGLQAGCDDYLTKPFSFSELAARVAALVRRTQRGEPLQDMTVADLRLNLLSRTAERAGNPLPLQPREFRLLAYLMSNAGDVVTRTMLLEAVWDYRFDPHTNVIDVHISRLRNKIDRGHAVPLIHTVRSVGYMLATEPPDATR